MKSMTNQKTFVMTYIGSKIIKAVGSIFADAVRIYDSDVLLDGWTGTENNHFVLNVTCCTCGDNDCARDCPKKTIIFKQ